MKTAVVNGCTVTVVPVIRGLVSEKETIRRVLENAYDAVGVSLGPEDVAILSKRNDATEKPDMSDLDAVYAHLLMRFGGVDLPVPAYAELVDVCKERSIEPIPLDMDDETFTELFCEKVRPMDLLKETKVAKKAMKHDFVSTTAGEFAVEWDDYVNRKIRGFELMSLQREVFIANEIAHHASGKATMLAVVELERMAGILDLLR